MIFTHNIKSILVNKIFVQTCTVFNTTLMAKHILSQNVIDNHKIQLIKLIIDIYVRIRLFHEAKLKSQKSEYIRHKYTKLVLFKNQ